MNYYKALRSNRRKGLVFEGCVVCFCVSIVCSQWGFKSELPVVLNRFTVVDFCFSRWGRCLLRMCRWYHFLHLRWLLWRKQGPFIVWLLLLSFVAKECGTWWTSVITVVSCLFWMFQLWMTVIWFIVCWRVPWRRLLFPCLIVSLLFYDGIIHTAG